MRQIRFLPHRLKAWTIVSSICMFFCSVSVALFVAIILSTIDFVRSMERKTLGFLGCGKISSAVCRGFATSASPPSKIYVSLRSIEKSQALKLEFPSLIEVLEDNNAIAELSDMIFIGLLPNVAEEVLPKLPLTKDKLIISMMAAVDYAKTLQLLPQIPADRIVRTVPLPAAARRSGPIIMFPAHSEVEQLLKSIGTPIVCAEEEKMKPMISITGHISSFYELLRTSQSFLVEKGTISFVFLSRGKLVIWRK